MYKLFSKILLPFFIALLLFPLLSCVSSQITYSQKDSFSDIMSNAYKSMDSIDGSLTYQVFFSIKKKEQCIKTSVLSDIKDDTTHPLRTAYIVEKIINVTPFTTSKNRKLEYSSLARNYSSNWDISREIRICGNNTDPIKTLSPGWYRIRFSAFTERAYSTTITIHSNNGIRFNNSLPPGYQ